MPQVAAYVSANKIEADYGRTWDRILPGPRYLEPDDGLGEAPPLGWTVMFPHILKGKAGDSAPGIAAAQHSDRSATASTSDRAASRAADCDAATG